MKLSFTNVFNMIAVSYYVGYRSNPPDEATVNDVHKWLEDNNIDTTQLVEWSANHCPQPETSTVGGTTE
jgi:hypothetical protein